MGADDAVETLAHLEGRIVMTNSPISRDPEVMGGTAVFRGTRVPLQTLVDHLGAGDTIDEFLEGFPSVRRDQVIAFLEGARDLMTAAAE